MCKLLPKLVLVLALVAGLQASSRAERVIGFNTDNLLFSVDTATSTRVDIGTFSGLAPGQTVASIDYRPNTGQLYAIGVAPGATPGFPTVEFYTVNLANAALTPVGVVHPAFFASSLPDSAIPSLMSMDFDPSVDRLRVVLATNSQQDTARLANVDAVGALSFTLNYDVPASISPSLTAVAYSNNGPLTDPATPATWYGYDDNTGRLVQPVVAPSGLPDYVVSASSPLVTLDGSTISPTQYVGFDISGATGIGYFSMQDDQTLQSSLYTIGLSGPSAGALNLLHDFNFLETVVEITVVPVPEPSTLVGGLLGAAALAFFRRRRA